MSGPGAGEIYLGLMSGTSLDGVDIALVDFAAQPPHLIYSATWPYDQALRGRIRDVASDQNASIGALCSLDTELGRHYAEIVNRSLELAGLSAAQVTAIGSHGQTLRHSPDSKLPYTLQVGDPNTIAARTRITTVADFRRKDVALGGQGAPLAPAYHQYMFHSATCHRAIVNIGGISNITSLVADPTVAPIGFDTGPGNTLLDHWSHSHSDQAYDEAGNWAASGKVIEELLRHMLDAEPFFKLAAPKSTGTDYFSPDWLRGFLQPDYAIEDVQATLVELTVLSIAQGLQQLVTQPDECLVCGGGAHNLYLMERLGAALPDCLVATTAHIGMDPDYVEAVAFAWLARQTLNQLPGNLPTVTRAKTPAILGGIFQP